MKIKVIYHSVYLLVFLFKIYFSVVYGQADTSLQIITDYESNLIFQSNKEMGKEIHADYTSNIYGELVEPEYGKVTDNPLEHMAFYTLLKNSASLYNKYTFELDVLFEHRGMSYGLYDMSNIIVYPYYRFNINENLKVFNSPVIFTFDIGSFRNEKLHNGLKIYNIDYQGGKAVISWRKLFFQYFQIADLSQSIGLQIEEYYDYSLGYKFEKRETGLQIGLNMSINNYIKQPNDSLFLNVFGLPADKYGIYHYVNSGIWTVYNFRSNQKLYTQSLLSGKPES